MGHAIASLFITSTQLPASVRVVFMNFNRAGTLANKSRTITCVPYAMACGSTADKVPCKTRNAQPCASDEVRERNVKSETEPIDGKASPRNPNELISNKSAFGNLEVAWRWIARDKSSWVMPQPSSVTTISFKPPSLRWMVIWRAPESIAFSTSSFKAAAGRSMTSPAAI